MSGSRLRGLAALAVVATAAGGCGLVKIKSNIAGLSGLGAGAKTPSATTPHQAMARRSAPASSGRPAVGQSRNTTPTVTAGPGYNGPECGNVLVDLSTIKHSSDLRGGYNAKQDDGLDKQVYRVACGRATKTWPRTQQTVTQPASIRRISAQSLHFAFDDRHFDPLAAALITLNWSEWQKPRHSGRSIYPFVIGMAKVYADGVDATALQARLGELKIAPEAAKLFAERFAAAKAKAQASAAAIEPALQPVMVELPARILAARRAYFAKNASYYGALDALQQQAQAARATGKVGGVIAKLVALRGRYIASCGKAACRYTPVYSELSRELAMAYVAAKDALSAAIETKPYQRSGSYVVSYAQELSRQQRQAGGRLAASWEKFHKAKRSGVDEQTARNLAGGSTGYDFRSERQILIPRTEMPNYAAALGSTSYSRFRATVAKLSRSAKGVKVVFKKERYTSSEPYACRRTRRVTRILNNGRLEYERICKWRKVAHIREVAKPVVLPTVDARQIRPGDEVLGLREKERARVIEVNRNKKQIQIGPDRIAG